ncbi:MAG: phage antirepressor N-terminal domain-containing protein [Bacteroides sp.]|nr:phage antirepressor N-terminal domain-containing protein [Bacteroides sp.]MCM1379987.1 phage antirepressor N-terminal domain-containing protein [Bacteroides sp.]MCM1446333.1 phage antirepressor N-terminal domain-containing protein [Prevotella sp.]
MGVDPEAQRQRIERHYILSSAAFTLKVVAADGKDRDMLCLPLEHVYGWLFTIDANLVAESARERVADYQRECYDALYRHFTGAQRRLEAIRAERLNPQPALF